MLVPDSQACGNQFSSTSPLPASSVTAAAAKLAALQNAVGNAQVAANALFVANPWESWAGGFNLMKDIQRGNTQAGTVSGTTPSGAPAMSQLPGLPPAGEGGSLWQRWTRNLGGRRGRGPRSGNARQNVQGWDSRFVTGPGGKFAVFPPAGNAGRRMGGGRFAGGAYGDARPGNCGTLDCSPGGQVIDCTVEAADVVPSDGIMPAGAPPVAVTTPPPNPALRTDQADNIVVPPPAQYSVPPATVPQSSMCIPPARTGNICLDLKRGAVFQHQVTPQVLYRCSQLGYVGVPGGPCPVVNGPQIQVSDAEMAAVPPYAAGMGMWTPSIAQPGAVPADCASGAGMAGVPWWVWALGGIALLAVAGGETKTKTTAASKPRRRAA